MDILKSIAENVIQGNAIAVGELTQKALRDGLNPQAILEKGLFSGMERIGFLFREEEIFVPEVMMAANAMAAGTQLLEPELVKAGGSKTSGKVLLGTVKGDVHNLGKKLVGIMLKGAGFEVIDLGECVTPEKFVDAALSKKPQVIGMSSLLTTTMPHMKTTIEALSKAGLRERVKTIIGGACVTQAYADEIGADAYAQNAGGAVEKVRDLIGSIRKSY